MHPEHVWLELPVLCTEPRQPNNHQLPRSSLCTAQVILDASVTHLVATQYVPSKLCWGSTGKSLHYERTLAKRVLRSHTEWLQGVQLRHSVSPVQYIDHGGWWLPSCCGSLGSLRQTCPGLNPGDCRAFHFLYFCLITSKLPYFQHEARCSEHLEKIWFLSGLPRGLEGPRANTKSGPHNMDYVRERVWGHGHRNFEILHALKCVLGAPKAFFVHAHSKYIPKSCRLAVSDRKVWPYGALPSRPCSSHMR